MRMNHFDRLRFELGAAHLHRLGACATAEFLADLCARIGGMPACIGLLAEYQARMSPATIRAACANQTRPRPSRPAEPTR